MLYPAVRPLLFRLEAERAHRLVFGALVACEQLLARRTRPLRAWTHPALAQELWSISFPNPVGLAAGFDKDARAPHVWPLLGFGFAELGTITAVAQPGNAPPRLFRLPRDAALINRLGFNNAGAAAVAARLAHLFHTAPPGIPIGINIGKSRVTPLDQAAGDYVSSLRHLFSFAAYVVINVSSPNTPGLRDLQAEDQLAALLDVLTTENAALAQAQQRPPRPLLIKVAPDLADDALAAVVQVARKNGAAGLVATNTTIRRDGLSTPIDEAGGLSGAPLRARATAVIRTLHRHAGAALPIIGVGGIFTAHDAYAKIRAGASLVQIYTGMIYEGPLLARRIAAGLVDLLRADGFTHLRQAVGRDA
ncbi:MAG TPA: quinone-dependent dihydroorotate dehydrogenase [Candidatus Acidoferrales bacterium]|nr:quinone-dependent dihydroorotate dehydrogenase [Candidatus Acidoferrales bacterium]